MTPQRRRRQRRQTARRVARTGSGPPASTTVSNAGAGPMFPANSTLKRPASCCCSAGSSAPAKAHRALPGVGTPVIHHAHGRGSDPAFHERATEPRGKHDDPIHLPIDKIRPPTRERQQRAAAHHARCHQGVGPQVLHIIDAWHPAEPFERQRGQSDGRRRMIDIGHVDAANQQQAEHRGRDRIKNSHKFRMRPSALWLWLG